MAANIESQTGRSVAAWIEIVNAAGLDGFSSVVDWLKREHGFGHFQARLIAEAHRGQA
jgi:hypothetical protein